MMTRRIFMMNAGLIAAAGWSWRTAPSWAAESFEVSHTDEEWRKLLTPEQFAVLRQAGTERPFTSPLLHEERRGVFACAGCDLGDFSSTTTVTGLPSTPSRNVMRQPQARRAWVNPFMASNHTTSITDARFIAFTTGP